MYRRLRLTSDINNRFSQVYFGLHRGGSSIDLSRKTSRIKINIFISNDTIKGHRQAWRKKPLKTNPSRQHKARRRLVGCNSGQWAKHKENVSLRESLFFPLFNSKTGGWALRVVFTTTAIIERGYSGFGVE